MTANHLSKLITLNNELLRILQNKSIKIFRINNRSFCHASPCLWNQLSKELRLPADHEDLSLSSDLKRLVTLSTYRRYINECIYLSISHTSVRHFLHHHRHHPLHLIFFTPGSNSSFPQIHSSTYRTDSLDSSCFSFSRACRF